MTSLEIILRKVKEGALSEEEAIQIINDIKSVNYYPYWPNTITYDTQIKPFPKYEITCNKTE